MENKHYRGGLVWPVILIAAGIVFLLNNLGVLSWDVWATLWRLWPVLLIAIGLEILIGRRSLLGSALVALALLVVLGLAIGLGLPQWTAVNGNTVERTETISEDLKGGSQAEVELSFGTGTLNLTALPAGSPQLIKGTLDLSRGETLGVSHSSADGVEQFSLESRNAWSQVPNVRSDDRKQWDIELNRDVPINLNLSTGVGRSILDLSQLNLTRLDINSGVGETNVKLPERGQFDVDLEGGIGEITLIVPQGLGVKIQAESGLGDVKVDGDFTRRDQEYTSSNYNTAEQRADIRVEGGIGRIVIRQVTE